MMRCPTAQCLSDVATGALGEHKIRDLNDRINSQQRLSKCELTVLRCSELIRDKRA